jgi:hypothetical protein
VQLVRSPLPLLTLLGATLVLGGCCYFFPCHPGTYIAGKVVDGVSKHAIANAAVHLYFYEASTAQSGCFALGGADGLPFEFGVSAPGYKSLVVPAHGGSYQATITLMPQGSTTKSTYQATSISSAQYAELSRGCP